MQLKGKKTTVVGLRRTGVAAAKFLASKGAIVTVTDKGDPKTFEKELEALKGADVLYALGKHDPKDFTHADMIVVSPGVPLEIPEIRSAVDAGVKVIGELELAACFLENEIVVAIGGTNGKSTVTTLIGEMLSNDGKEVFTGGNLGNPLLNLVNSGEKVDVAVVEVSSFQLEAIETFQPDVSIMMNITPDHLDRYADMDAYVRAKSRMFLNQAEDDWAIVNAEDELVLTSLSGNLPEPVHFSNRRRPSLKNRAWVEGDKIVLEIPKVGRGAEKISIKHMKIAGAHNRENAVAAAAAARLAGASLEAIERTLAEFNGLPHRVQFVRELDGVKYYDDSKGTNVGAVEKSLAGFDSPVVLIAGGLDKGSDFTTLKPLLKEKARALVLMGAAAEKMLAQMGGVVPTETATDMKDAVRRARKLAKKGDIVLLSPACASFDMFRDYGHRGDVFAAEARALA